MPSNCDTLARISEIEQQLLRNLALLGETVGGLERGEDGREEFGRGISEFTVTLGV
jgi:hypothetical protein